MAEKRVCVPCVEGGKNKGVDAFPLPQQPASAAIEAFELLARERESLTHPISDYTLETCHLLRVEF